MNKILIIFLKDNLYQLLLLCVRVCVCLCDNIWNLLFYRSYSISRFVCLSIRPKGERVHCPKSIFSVMPSELKDTLVVFFLAAIRDRCMELRMKITITIKKIYFVRPYVWLYLSIKKILSFPSYGCNLPCFPIKFYRIFID